MGRVDGKVAIVTGAAAGIGLGIAAMLAREGARVVLTDMDPDAGEAACAAISDSEGTARFIQHDVSDEAGWSHVIAETERAFGGLDVLVNNAGIQMSKALEETSLEDWRRIFAVNVEGVFLGTRSAMTVMKRKGSGSIINVSSTMDRVVNELNAAYCASKAAVTQFTRAAAMTGAEDGNRIRVNSIHPGVIATPMIEREIRDVAEARGDSSTDSVRAEWNTLCPLGMGVPDDIAYAALYLASEESKYVTGSDMLVDGGHVIGRDK